jgi:MraZ protein
MFLGQFKYTTDSKGRLTIPVRFRSALAPGAYLIQGFERNLIVHTAENFNGLARKASALSTTQPGARAVRRLIFGGATEVALDAAGRINIPPFLRDYAGLDGEVYIVGVGEYFEIWQAEEWENQLKAVTDPEANAQRFSEYDLSTG